MLYRPVILIIIAYCDNNNSDNNNDNNNSNDVIVIKSIKNAESKDFLLPDLSQKGMVLLKRKKIVFYFLIKIPNLNLYWNQNGKWFPNCIDRLGCQKRETKHQQTNKGKPREK